MNFCAFARKILFHLIYYEDLLCAFFLWQQTKCFSLSSITLYKMYNIFVFLTRYGAFKSLSLSRSLSHFAIRTIYLSLCHSVSFSLAPSMRDTKLLSFELSSVTTINVNYNWLCLLNCVAEKNERIHTLSLSQCIKCDENIWNAKIALPTTN